ncbi:hypothetical protein JCM3774_004279, partial [Rhodotorula dairenensis]
IEVDKPSSRLWNPPALNSAHPSFDPDLILRLYPSQRKQWQALCAFFRVSQLGLSDERLEGQAIPPYSSGIVTERLGLVSAAMGSGSSEAGGGQEPLLNPTDTTSYAVRIELTARHLRAKRAFVDYVTQYEEPKFADLSEDWLDVPFGVATFGSTPQAASLACAFYVTPFSIEST